jgi:hypothetical protein
MEDEDLTRRAVVAYVRTGGVAGDVSDRRSGPVTVGGKTYVALRNRRGGVVAVYRYRTTGLLRRLKRWPKAIENMPTAVRGGVQERRSTQGGS